MTDVLALAGIRKQFGAVEALAGVDFALAAGQVHALLGENGAGKSTLMKIAYGLVQPDAGEIRVRGEPVRVADPRAAHRLGLGMVHQHFTDIPAFTVAENVALTAGWPVRPAAMRARVRELSEATGLSLDPDLPAARLSAGLRQRLEVLKALAADARILLFDEPTSVLPPTEVAEFLALITRLRDQGIASVLITHKLQEALAIADRVTVLRRGAVVRSGPVAGETALTLATAMLGGEPPAGLQRRPPGEGPARAKLTEVQVARSGPTGSGLRTATLELHAGTVAGIAAVEGNGQRELLRLVAGVMTPAAGTAEVTPPIAFIPEDRTSEAILGELPLTAHLVLSQGESGAWIRGGWIDWAAAGRRMGELITAFGVRAAGTDAPASSLSGGNQQRMLIACAMERRPAVLVAENPARGLDLRATAEVYQRLREAAAGGAAVLVHCPDLDELLALADRVFVMREGALIPMPADASRDAIGRAMLSGEGAA